jgi:hypothetical protein
LLFQVIISGYIESESKDYLFDQSIKFHLLNKNGIISKSEFKFDPKNLEATFGICQDKKSPEKRIVCKVEILYDSPSEFMITKSQNEKLKMNDLIKTIIKGKNILYEYEMPIKDEQTCLDFNKLPRKGLSNIKKIFLKLKSDKKLAFSFINRQFQVFISFFKYPFNEFTPAKIDKIIERNSNYIKLRIHPFIKKQTLTGSIFDDIKGYIQTFNENIINKMNSYRKNIAEFCHKNNLNTGKQFIFQKK